MGTLAFIRRTLMGLVGTILAAAFLAAVSHADELGVGAGSRGIVLHDAAETLRDWCVPDEAGRLWLTLPGGARFELVTSTSDPAITNPGDGAFHPFDPAEVGAALRDLGYPVGDLAVDVFVLPYPRRSGLESAAGPGLILLSPGVRALPREQQHAEFVHELGHVVQYAHLPDADADAWAAYRRLRGIEDATVYASWASHERRPHEIFAEDFRALFGGPTANYSGAIENAALAHPETVSGLREFLLSLPAGEVGTRLVGTPNPSRGAVRFARPYPTSATLDVYDVAGRRLAGLAARAVAGGTEWRWDGRDASGVPAGPGVVFARVRGTSDVPLRVTLVR
jgi:hypothetical protein